MPCTSSGLCRPNQRWHSHGGFPPYSRLSAYPRAEPRPRYLQEIGEQLGQHLAREAAPLSQRPRKLLDRFAEVERTEIVTGRRQAPTV